MKESIRIAPGATIRANPSRTYSLILALLLAASCGPYRANLAVGKERLTAAEIQKDVLRLHRLDCDKEQLRKALQEDGTETQSIAVRVNLAWDFAGALCPSKKTGE